MKPVITGNAFTLNVDVLPLDKVEVQRVDAFCKDVIVMVVDPVLPTEPEGIVKEPLPPTVVSDAVSPVAELAPLRL